VAEEDEAGRAPAADLEGVPGDAVVAVVDAGSPRLPTDVAAAAAAAAAVAALEKTWWGWAGRRIAEGAKAMGKETPAARAKLSTLTACLVGVVLGRAAVAAAAAAESVLPV
jgi:hypothetical protein